MMRVILCGGVWSRYIGLTNSEVWAGSNLNEFYNLGDSVADQRAIKDGRETKLK